MPLVATSTSGPHLRRALRRNPNLDAQPNSPAEAGSRPRQTHMPSRCLLPDRRKAPQCHRKSHEAHMSPHMIIMAPRLRLPENRGRQACRIPADCTSSILYICATGISFSLKSSFDISCGCWSAFSGPMASKSKAPGPVCLSTAYFCGKDGFVAVNLPENCQRDDSGRRSDVEVTGARRKMLSAVTSPARTFRDRPCGSGTRNREL